MADVEEIDRPSGPPLAADQLPEWLRQFDLFLDVRRFENGELLAECLFCELALVVPTYFAPHANISTILNLAQHGVQHAVALVPPSCTGSC